MLNIRNLLTVALATSLLSCAAATAELTPPRGDAADVAAQLAPRIVERISRDCPPRCRVAVFPFGDLRGRISPTVAETAEILRGELIQQLANAAEGRMYVLDRDGLAREFRRAGIDASAVSPQDPMATAGVLQKIGVDVAITGTMNPPVRPGEPREVRIWAIMQTGELVELSNQSSQVILPSSPVVPRSDSRFNMEVLVDGRPLPLQRSTDPDSGYFNALFLVLPRQMVGTEYQLRVTNRGTPSLVSRTADKSRLFGAVVTVDGVNTVYQDTGYGQVGPVVRHPKNCVNWLLSGPGHALVPDAHSPQGYRIESTSGAGQSVLTIPGFQNGPQYAKAFTFAMVRDSVAENLGITNDIGMIAVHFYPEVLPGDQPPMPVVEKSLGATRPGRDIANPVFKVRASLKDNPVEVWRIFYRYEDDPTLHRLALKPITG